MMETSKLGKGWQRTRGSESRGSRMSWKSFRSCNPNAVLPPVSATYPPNVNRARAYPVVFPDVPAESSPAGENQGGTAGTRSSLEWDERLIF